MKFLEAPYSASAGFCREACHRDSTGSRVARCGAMRPWALPYPCSGRFSLCMNPDSHTAKTKRVAAKGIAAIPAESIPIISVAVLIADTGYELYAA
jgi:hypothetical protein